MNAEHSSSIDVRRTAKGIAVRAGILSVVSIFVSAWLFSLAARVASGMVKFLAGALLLAIGGSVATWEVRKARKHLAARHETPLLG